MLSAFIAATDICSFNESGYMFDDFARDKGPIDSSRSGAIGPRRLAPIGSSRSDPIPKLVSNVTYLSRSRMKYLVTNNQQLPGRYPKIGSPRFRASLFVGCWFLGCSVSLSLLLLARLVLQFMFVCVSLKRALNQYCYNASWFAQRG